jgi:hypothetical protein
MPGYELSVRGGIWRVYNARVPAPHKVVASTLVFSILYSQIYLTVSASLYLHLVFHCASTDWSTPSQRAEEWNPCIISILIPLLIQPYIIITSITAKQHTLGSNHALCMYHILV